MIVQRHGEDPHVYRSMYGGAGTVSTEWYFRHGTRQAAHVMHYRLDPGTSEGEHVHEAGNPGSCSVDDSDELYVIVRGDVTMTVDGERIHLHPGDAVYAPAGSVHGVVNESADIAELVLIWGPPAPHDADTTHP